jgi:hypothetical protein
MGVPLDKRTSISVRLVQSIQNIDNDTKKIAKENLLQLLKL